MVRPSNQAGPLDQCESCGQPLPSPGAVCMDCETKTQAERETGKGKYRCPVCEEGFDRPRYELWPRGAKWYTPRQFKPTCPACRSFLRDRKNPAPPVRLILLLIAAAIFAQTALPKTYTKGALAVLLVTFALLHLRRRERHVQPGARFAKDDD